MKELEQGNARLKRAVADLMLDKVILRGAAEGDWQAPSVATVAPIMFRSGVVFRSAGLAVCWASRARHSDTRP